MLYRNIGAARPAAMSCGEIMHKASRICFLLNTRLQTDIMA